MAMLTEAQARLADAQEKQSAARQAEVRGSCGELLLVLTLEQYQCMKVFYHSRSFRASCHVY